MKGIRAETHQKEFPPGRGFYPSLSTSNHYHNTKPLVHLPGGPIGKLVMHRRNRKKSNRLTRQSHYALSRHGINLGTCLAFPRNLREKISRDNPPAPEGVPDPAPTHALAEPD